MRDDGGVPWLDDGPEGLGIRVPTDIKVDHQGFVRPAPPTERGRGCSVTPDAPDRMRPARRPKALGGDCPLPLWRIDEETLGALLRFHSDPGHQPQHGVIEPAHEMTFVEFRAALHATRHSWVFILGGPDEEES